MSGTSTTFRMAVLISAVSLPSCGSGTDGGNGPGGGAVAHVRIAPEGLTLPVGGSGNLTADVRDAGNVALPDSAVSWSSQTAAIATVEPNGTVSGVSIGVTRVIAAVGEHADTVSVIVVDHLTLTIEPAAATIAVGATQAYRVVARNGNGDSISTPAVTWTSGTPNVGTITAGGVATGIHEGQTIITARAGTLTSTPALLIVSSTASACGGIQLTPRWSVELAAHYKQTGSTPDNQILYVEHTISVRSTLTAVGPLGSAVEWSGSLTGTATVEKSDQDLNQHPAVTSTLNGEGPIVADLGRSVFILRLDPVACTYSFSLNPYTHVTLTTPTSVDEADLPIAVLLKGSKAVGNWQVGGLKNNVDEYPAHSVAFVPADSDAYISYGAFGQLFWVPPSDLAMGYANVAFNINPLP